MRDTEIIYWTRNLNDAQYHHFGISNKIAYKFLVSQFFPSFFVIHWVYILVRVAVKIKKYQFDLERNQRWPVRICSIVNIHKFAVATRQRNDLKIGLESWKSHKSIRHSNSICIARENKRSWKVSHIACCNLPPLMSHLIFISIHTLFYTPRANSICKYEEVDAVSLSSVLS